MELNEYKAILSDIGGIQLLESFIKRDSYNTDVPEYLDTMFIEQADDSTLVYLNDCKFRYNKLSEDVFQSIKKEIEESNYGTAVMLVNSKSRLKSSLKEANAVVSKMVKFINDNLHIIESEGKKVINEDWTRDFTRKSYKKGIIKTCELTESGLRAAIQDGNKTYLVDYKVNKKLANKVINSFNYLGESYSRMILSDIMNVPSTYHVTTRFTEGEFLGRPGGVYAITNLEALPDAVKITFIDRNQGTEYTNEVAIDMQVVKDDGLNSVEEVIEPFKDELEDMKFEDDVDYAVDQSAVILSGLSSYFAPEKFGNYKATKEKHPFRYANGLYVEKTNRDSSGKIEITGKAYVPYDVDWVGFKNNEEKEKYIADGSVIQIDGMDVKNYEMSIYFRDRDGYSYKQTATMKPALRQQLSLEEWYDELMAFLPSARTSEMTFEKAFENSRKFVRKLNMDATLGAMKQEKGSAPEAWLQEDAGALQTSDVPEKVDYGDKLEKPSIHETQELVLEAWLVDLVNRGFEPDADGYLTRSGKYLVKEKNALVVKHHSELWEADGTPINNNVDIVSILD